MTAHPESLGHRFKPYAARLAPLPPDGRVKVLQFGPSLSVKGGVTSVAQLIWTIYRRTCRCEHVADDGGRLHDREVRRRSRARCRSLRRSLESRRPDHRAHPLRLARQHAAQTDPRRDGGARRPAADPACARLASSTSFHRKLPAAVRRNVNRSLQRANVFITLSSQWRDFYVNECELSPSQVVVLPNPVRLPADVPDRSGRQQPVQFLHLGRLGERKGGYDLVNAFAGLPEALRNRARLVMAGDGDVEGMRKLAAPLGDRVRRALVDRARRARSPAGAERRVRVAVARRRRADGAARGDGQRPAVDHDARGRHSRRVPRWPGRRAGDARQHRADPRGHGAHDHARRRAPRGRPHARANARGSSTCTCMRAAWPTSINASRRWRRSREIA